MSFRFRRRYYLTPNLRINLGNRLLNGFSFGTRGAWFTRGLLRPGTRLTFGEPSTGLRWTTYRSDRRKNPTRGDPGLWRFLAAVAVVFVLVALLAH